MRLVSLLTFLLFFALIPCQTKAQLGLEVKNDTLTKTVLIHPVIGGEGSLSSMEHTYEEGWNVGDQIGRDFMVTKMNDNGILRRFKNDGRQNKDWYGWRNDVMAPFDATIKKVMKPDTTNKPGAMNRNAPTGRVFFEKDNGLPMVYAHVREIKVEKGDHVEAGEVIAKVGNNGNSRAPHIHVGAWKEDEPLQIQVDLYAEKRSYDKEM